MKRFRLLYAGVGAAALLGASVAANAGVTITNGVTQGTFATAESTPSYPDGASYNAAYTNVLTPDPSVSAVASAGGSIPWIVTQADSYVEYYFTVVGSGSAPSALLSVNYSLSVNQIASAGDAYATHVAGDSVSAQAELTVGSVGINLLCNGTNCSGGNAGPNSAWQQGNASFYVTPNVANEVYIYASAYVEGNGYASAMVDPVITIDPTFLANNPGYSLAFDQGVGNTAAPEPSTWVLMTLGLGLMGSGLRKRASQRLRPA